MAKEEDVLVRDVEAGDKSNAPLPHTSHFHGECEYEIIYPNHYDKKS